MAISIGKINYEGWPNCYRLSNGLVELVVTTDVGPRVIRFGFAGGDNEFAEFPESLGKTGGETWQVYGGHRLWHAPEAVPRTYYPDNQPVSFEEHDGFTRLIQPTETTTGIQKEIDVRLAPDAASALVTHRLYNRNPWEVELAPWALSVMRPGGTAIIPLPPRGMHPQDLLPTSRIILWPYTDMSDPRWVWGNEYVMLRQDTSRPQPQKAGVMASDGWIAYANHGHLFVKTFAYVTGAAYPDLGCSVETFTNAEMLEVETLGPLTQLEPGTAVTHTETWHLFRDIPPPHDEAGVDSAVLPKINAIKAEGGKQL
ncbi:MAG TPA: hypothetical protein VF177_07610 [Anaerolineae bacterium]